MSAKKRSLSIRKTLLAENALTTLDAVMEFIGFDPEDETVPEATRNNLERLVNAASSYIETMTGRKFARRDYEETHYGSGSQELCVDQYPITKVARILDVENGQEVPPESYSLTEAGNIGVIYRDVGWASRGYHTGLANDAAAYKRYLKIFYTAGYILPKDGTEEAPCDLPFDLQYVVWQMVQQQWELAKNGANGLAAFSISDVSWTFDKEFSSQIKDVINKYMRLA